VNSKCDEKTKEKKNTIEINFKCEKAKQAKPSQPKEAREEAFIMYAK
jgi:hypothetical protein